MHNPYSLKGKTILITGASSGIGKEISIQCYKSNAKVIAIGRDASKMQLTKNEIFSTPGGGGGVFESLLLDLTVEENLISLINSVDELDGVVLCAGVSHSFPIKANTRQKIDKIFEINFFAQIELLRLLIKNKKFNPNASIVGISSIGGNLTFSSAMSAYGASKAAFLSYLKTAARELAPRYRVNSILPGSVETPMLYNGYLSQEQIDYYTSKIPLGRNASPEDIAYGAIYLLSDASQYVTGTELVIDGGVTLL